jgi:branched-chain amino acid aminotransferase
MSNKYTINIERTPESRLKNVDFNNLTFGKVLSDHMFMVEYKDGAWQTPEISQFRDLSFNPSMASLHYGQAVFEGLKAFKSKEGKTLIFRPELHAERINLSAERQCMPKIPEELFLEGLYELLRVDNDWIPDGEGQSLYIRPVMFATEQALGVRPSSSYLFLIFTSPVAQYYNGMVKVLVEEENTRAANGVTGYVKTCGNYAASLLPAQKAIQAGYDQVLWTDGAEHKYVEEIGTMNVWFDIDGTIVTPKLSTSILGGITRRSVVELAKKWGYEIEERKIEIAEIIEAMKAGKLNDAFGTGTAATITHISDIGYRGDNYKIAEGNRAFSTRVGEYLGDLKIGEAEDFMSWMKSI